MTSENMKKEFERQESGMIRENNQPKKIDPHVRDIQGYIRIDTTIPLLTKILGIVEKLDKQLDGLEKVVYER